MRTISKTAQFKNDYKRELKSKGGKTLEAKLTAVLEYLIADKLLPEKYKDHALVGKWAKQNYRDCHVRPDLVLIYGFVGKTELALVRLGSHSKLFG
jgi:mRNA interferase YafQ